jgi:ABC-type phosphate transport system substrate-binding protein
LLAAAPARAAEPRAPPTIPEFQVIVHASNPVTMVARKWLADAFLKKVTRWGDRDVIQPVDLAASSGTRERFSQRILDRSTGAVRNYWQLILFSGRGLPPPELASDDLVITYVRQHPWAIGYVSGLADVRAVRVVTVR